MITHCHSPKSTSLLHRSKGELNRHVVESPPLYHHALTVTIISSFLLEMQYCFWFPIFLNRGSSRGFHLVFPVIVALTLQVRKPMCRFCQQLSVSIPIMHYRSGEITTGWILGPLWDKPELKFHWSPDLCKPLLWLVCGPQWCFGCPEISSEPVFSSLWKFWYFLFPNAQLPW